MAEVLVNDDGEGYLRDPETGSVVTIPREDINTALRSGYTPVEKYEARAGASLDIARETLDSPARAFGYGALRGATFGLSDAFIEPELARVTEKLSPNASLAGEVTGAVGSALIPGSPVARVAGLGAKAGAAATRLGTRAAARLGEGALAKGAGFLAKGAGAATRGAVEGSLYGAGTGIGEALRNRDHIGAGDAASHIAERAKEGAIYGGVVDLGLFGLGSAAKAIGKKAFKRRSVELSHRQIPGISGGKRVVEREVPVAGFEVPGKPATRMESKLEGYPGRGARWAPKDEVLDEIDRLAVAKRQESLTGQLDALDKMNKGRSAQAYKIRQELGEIAGIEERSVVGHLIKNLASWKASWAIAGGVTGGPMGTVAGMMIAKQVQQTVKKLTPHIESVADRVGSALQKAGKKVAPLVNKGRRPAQAAIISQADLNDVRKDLLAAKPDQIAKMIQTYAPPDAPPELVAEVVNNHAGAVDFLKEKMPKDRRGDLPTHEAGDASFGERLRFTRYLRALQLPQTLFEELQRGEISKETVEVWQRFHPKELAQLRKMVDDRIKEAKDQGKVLTRVQARQVRALRGQQMFDPRVIRAVQGNYQQGDGSGDKGPGRPRKPSINMADRALTPGQKLIGA